MRFWGHVIIMFKDPCTHDSSRGIVQSDYNSDNIPGSPVIDPVPPL